MMMMMTPSVSLARSFGQGLCPDHYSASVMMLTSSMARFILLFVFTFSIHSQPKCSDAPPFHASYCCYARACACVRAWCDEHIHQAPSYFMRSPIHCRYFFSRDSIILLYLQLARLQCTKQYRCTLHTPVVKLWVEQLFHLHRCYRWPNYFHVCCLRLRVIFSSLLRTCSSVVKA